MVDEPEISCHICQPAPTDDTALRRKRSKAQRAD